MSNKVTCLVDGKNTLYRHNFMDKAVDPDGNKVGGVHGMVTELTNIMKNLKPDNLIVCWDKGKSHSRLAIYPEYKGNRKKDDVEFFENLTYQINQAMTIIKSLPVKQIAIQDVEADDIIGYLCKKLSGHKIVFSNDSDFIQLINEDTSLFLASKKKMLTHKNVNEYLGFNQKHYVIWKSLCGDSSDNIKGLPGVGDKTATKIVLGEKKIKIKGTENEQILNRNLKLIKIASLLSNDEKRAIVNAYLKEKKKKPNSVAVRMKFKELGFRKHMLNFQYILAGFRKLNSEFH